MSNALKTGQVWLFGDNVNTDAMAPGSTIFLEWEERRASLFPEYPGRAVAIEPGDFLVAGNNWGQGSSREQAVENLVALGIGAVIAESFTRIFQRNAIANALPVITCPGISALVKTGEKLALDLKKFEVTAVGSGQVLEAKPYNQMMQDIVSDGGMMAQLEQRFGVRS